MKAVISKKIQIGYFLVGILILGASCSQNSTTKSNETPKERRIVTLNGAVTEVVAAAGFASSIVGVDVTSNFPASVQQLPKIGHNRNIQAEGVLALSPTQILGNEGNLNSEVKQQFESVNIPCQLFAERSWTVDGTKSFIQRVCDYLEVPEAAKPMHADIQAKLDNVQAFATPPRVLFIYARGAGSMMVAGEGTQLQAIIELAGGENAAQGFKEFKPLSPEALVEANPQVVLLFNDGLESLEGNAGLLEIPGMKETIAGKQEAFVAMDGALLSNFGPRLGDAALALNQKLHQMVASAQ